MQSLLALAYGRLNKRWETPRNPAPTQAHVLLGGVSCIMFTVEEYVPNTDSCVCAVVVASSLRAPVCSPHHMHLRLFLSFSSLFSLSSSWIGGLKDITQTL